MTCAFRGHSNSCMLFIENQYNSPAYKRKLKCLCECNYMYDHRNDRLMHKRTVQNMIALQLNSTTIVEMELNVTTCTVLGTVKRSYMH